MQFNEYNSDQGKRVAYDRFKKVSSNNTKQIAYKSLLDTNKFRKSVLTEVNYAIVNLKASNTKQDVYESMKKFSDTLKIDLKKTINGYLYKLIPFARNFLITANNVKKLYQIGPQSTYKMLTDILDSNLTIPNSTANYIMKLITTDFNVEKFIDNHIKIPYNKLTLKNLKTVTHDKLIDLSKNLDTAISNIDCSILSVMSTIGLGKDTLNLLKSGRLIMSNKHPRAKTLKHAIAIIKPYQNSRFNAYYSPNVALSLLNIDDELKSNENDDDPNQVASKNVKFLKNVPHLDNHVLIPKEFRNKKKSLGVIVVHPEKHIEYKEVNDRTELNKLVGDQTKKYKHHSKSNYPKLKVNTKHVIDITADDIKKKAQQNGMSKNEMINEIIKSLNK